MPSALPGVIGLLVVGVALVVLGVVRAQRQRARHARWTHVTGRVTRELVTGSDAVSYRPVVQFPGPHGEVTATPRWSTWNGVSRVGRKVDVWFDPASPTDCDAVVGVWDRSGAFWLAASVPFLLLGGLSLLP